MTTKKLYQLDKIVEQVLREYPTTQSDDFCLIKMVYLALNLIDIDTTIIPFLSIAKQKGIPPFESITRARRKVQKRCPELAVKKVVEERYNQTSEYIRYGIEGR